MRLGRYRSTWLAVLTVAGLCFATVPARAGDAAGAEALYKEGKALAKAGKYEQACPKLEASYKLDKGLGTLVNLADCHEKLGKLATAWAEWTEAVDMAKAANDERLSLAEGRVAKLAPRLPKLQVDVAKPVSGLVVFRGEVEIAAGSYGTALPVDPGEHVLSVRRGERTLKTETATAKEAETTTVSFDLVALDQQFPAAKEPAVSDKPAPPVVVVKDRPTEQPSSSQKTYGYVIGGVGVVALLVAGGLELVALSKKSNADEPDQCVNNYCSPKGIQSVDSARTFANIGQWVGIGGVLLTAVGATLVFTAPSAPQTGQAPRVQQRRVSAGGWLGPGAGGVAISGSL